MNDYMGRIDCLTNFNLIKRSPTNFSILHIYGYTVNWKEKFDFDTIHANWQPALLDKVCGLYLVFEEIVIKLLKSLETLGQVFSVDLCVECTHVFLAQEMSTEHVEPEKK